MKIIGTMLARNEAWCVRASARVALNWCDELVILDHLSTDSTPAIIQELMREFGERIRPLWWGDPNFRETTLRQMCLIEARTRGATHVAIIDADEIATAPMTEWLVWRAGSLYPNQCLALPTICVWGDLDHYRCEEGWAWARNMMPVLIADGVEVTWCAGHDGYDWHMRAPFGVESLVSSGPPGSGGVMHLQFCNSRRLRAKQALYQMNELLRWPLRQTREDLRRRYEGAVREEGIRLRAIPPDWWATGIKQLVDAHAEPWQELKVKRLLQQHGTGAFHGLNLFGIE